MRSGIEYLPSSSSLFSFFSFLFLFPSFLPLFFPSLKWCLIQIKINKVTYRTDGKLDYTYFNNINWALGFVNFAWYVTPKKAPLHTPPNSFGLWSSKRLGCRANYFNIFRTVRRLGMSHFGRCSYLTECIQDMERERKKKAFWKKKRKECWHPL